MKKLIALLMTLAIVVSLCACGSSSNGSTDTNDTVSESSVPETSNEDTESQQPEETDTETQQPEETDTETQQPEEVQEPAAMESGDTGDGPADLDAGLVKFTVPEGYSYEVYDFYIDEDDSLHGSIVIDINETGSYDTPVRVNVTTQNMVYSQDDAIQHTIDLCNLQTYEKGEYTIGDTATYGENTYTQIDISTEWSEETYFTAYADNGNSYGEGVFIRVVVNTNEMAADDPLVKAILESLVVVTK